MPKKKANLEFSVTLSICSELPSPWGVPLPRLVAIFFIRPTVFWVRPLDEIAFTGAISDDDSGTCTPVRRARFSTGSTAKTSQKQR
jgi:hypothetical protein